MTLRAFKKQNILNKVIVARDGKEALDYLFCTDTYADRDPEDYPAVILLDLKLPKVGGLEVLRRLREDERTRYLPVIILTSSAEDQDVVNGYKLGANRYIRKPMDFARFAEAVRNLGIYWLLLNESMPRGGKT